MLGKIKTYKSDKAFGFIIPSDGSSDIFFHLKSVSDKDLPLELDTEVEFEVAEITGKLQAQNVRRKAIATKSRKSVELRGKPGAYLENWAFIPFDTFTTESGVIYEGVLSKLAVMALDENWDFGPDLLDARMRILRSYLTYTFFRLWKENKVKENFGQNESWASFNTGLVNKLFDPIYALFERNPVPNRPWKFYAFCVPGIGPGGKKLTSIFSPLPEPPQYFENPSDVLFDTDAEIHPQFDHIVRDGIARDRFPEEFLIANLPRAIPRESLTKLQSGERATFLKELADMIEADPQCYRSINNRIRDAIELAQKRVRWNYKTAIPHYFPTRNTMSLLLPLALVDDNRVDIALVIQKQPSGSYNGSTVLPLSWAYKNARLVCRPDSDWLTTEVVVNSTSDSDEVDD